jgi:hypothetical protein
MSKWGKTVMFHKLRQTSEETKYDTHNGKPRTPLCHKARTYGKLQLQI